MTQLIGKTDTNCSDKDALTRKSWGACFMISSLIITLEIRESSIRIGMGQRTKEQNNWSEYKNLS